MSTTTTRKETPCLFNGAMVRAILDGRKTQTRRIVDRVKRHGKVTQFGRSDTPGYDWRFRCRRGLWQEYRHADFLKLSPLGGIGDLVYIRETWARFLIEKHSEHIWGNVVYRATHAGMNPECEGFSKWRPSIHMPKWAARIWLEITGLRVERVRDISEEDAIAEGAQCAGFPASLTNRGAFAKLWVSAYGEESWERDWVWVNEFKRVERL